MNVNHAQYRHSDPTTRLHDFDGSGATPGDWSSVAAEAEAPLSKPGELVVFYDPQPQIPETSLLKRLLALDPQETIFKRHFRNSRHVLNEIGPCASDLVWRRALKEIEATATPVYEEDDEHAPNRVAIAKTRLKIRNVVKNSVFAMPNLDPMSRGMNVTPKFIKLVQILNACEVEGPSFRGLVFGG